MNDQEKTDFIDKMASQIGEHFEHVQILVAWNENGSSFSMKRGVGNWHARQGLAHEFIAHDIAQDAAIQIAEQLKPEEE